ncbi:MAG: group III truncated hemoglobin [Flavisolibacter sp.]
MKKDIETREELEKFLWAFYERAFADELIGRFFAEVVPLDLDTHVPVIANFWESVAFNKPSYRKNVMEVHQHIHDLSSIKKEHLDRWVKLFTETLTDNFDGARTELMKQRARSIATLMDIKLNHEGIGKK